VDVSRSKLDKIETNCKRMGISIVSTCLADQVGGLDPGSFDLVLVDVPCSNTGVLARRAEARWRFDPQALVKLTEDQRALVELARQFARGGGRMVYSTCSIEPEECGELAHRVRGMNMLREQLTLPAGADDSTRWCDGGYFAVFEA
jgi:16S rRNA (cytosine967-C5)-methyltransferase